MKRPEALLLVAVACVCGHAQERDSAARPLTVEVMSARQILSVKITPLGQNETIKLCAACKPNPMLTPLTATVHGDALELAPGKRTGDVILEGAFRLAPDGDAKPMTAVGVWKLTVAHDEMRVLLTLDSERYVALALRGEAGAQEPLESMKAMAVLVRTFALENADRHRREGFNLCDSTHCQALKFGTPSELVDRAVRETTGESLWYGSRRALVFYTQNCGGESEDARQAWPGTVAPYLSAHADPWCTRRGAAAWHAEIALSDLERVAQSSQWKLPAHIDDVEIAKHTDQGRVLRLEFTGNGARVPVSANRLRFALNRTLGWNQLRSDWYTVALRGGVLHFEGRGYGHGVGLCQAGATEMATEGHSAAEILDFYFPGTRIGVTPDDHGWASAHGTGWTLRTTEESMSLIRAGDAAWTRARELYPPGLSASTQQSPEPEVWVMPTTELFRQATNEPGWMLASTQGTRIFLQPEAMLKKDGQEDGTLLHEFLHVLVESESSPQTPLWLREGIVEALAGDRPASVAEAHLDLRTLEAQLTRPATQAESQRAHAEAARLANALIAGHGLDQVRQWVRSESVPDAALKPLLLTPPRRAPARAPSTPP